MGFLGKLGDILLPAVSQCCRCKNCGKSHEENFSYETENAIQFYKELSSKSGKILKCEKCQQNTPHGLGSYVKYGIEGRKKLYNSIKNKLPNDQKNIMNQIYFVNEKAQTVLLEQWTTDPDLSLGLIFGCIVMIVLYLLGSILLFQFQSFFDVIHSALMAMSILVFILIFGKDLVTTNSEKKLELLIGNDFSDEINAGVLFGIMKCNVFLANFDGQRFNLETTNKVQNKFFKEQQLNLEKFLQNIKCNKKQYTSILDKKTEITKNNQNGNNANFSIPNKIHQLKNQNSHANSVKQQKKRDSYLQTPNMSFQNLLQSTTNIDQLNNLNTINLNNKTLQTDQQTNKIPTIQINKNEKTEFNLNQKQNQQETKIETSQNNNQKNRLKKFQKSQSFNLKDDNLQYFKQVIRDLSQLKPENENNSNVKNINKSVTPNLRPSLTPSNRRQIIINNQNQFNQQQQQQLKDSQNLGQGPQSNHNILQSLYPEQKKMQNLKSMKKINIKTPQDNIYTNISLFEIFKETISYFSKAIHSIDSQKKGQNLDQQNNVNIQIKNINRNNRNKSKSINTMAFQENTANSIIQEEDNTFKTISNHTQYTTFAQNTNNNLLNQNLKINTNIQQKPQKKKEKFKNLVKIFFNKLMTCIKGSSQNQIQIQKQFLLRVPKSQKLNNCEFKDKNDEKHILNIEIFSFLMDPNTQNLTFFCILNEVDPHQKLQEISQEQEKKNKLIQSSLNYTLDGLNTLNTIHNQHLLFYTNSLSPNNLFHHSQQKIKEKVMEGVKQFKISQLIQNIKENKFNLVEDPKGIKIEFKNYNSNNNFYNQEFNSFQTNNLNTQMPTQLIENKEQTENSNNNQNQQNQNQTQNQLGQKQHNQGHDLEINQNLELLDLFFTNILKELMIKADFNSTITIEIKNNHLNSETFTVFINYNAIEKINGSSNFKKCQNLTQSVQFINMQKHNSNNESLQQYQQITKRQSLFQQQPANHSQFMNTALADFQVDYKNMPHQQEIVANNEKIFFTEEENQWSSQQKQEKYQIDSNLNSDQFREAIQINIENNINECSTQRQQNQTMAKLPSNFYEFKHPKSKPRNNFK
ncbi:hypothetical protein PPERSA_06973 [Pseudocohnilembus persalinus]|uniref:Transmembrane protein n=1 Tax=Pseudocohnilembus persalinus TaxID=266149 RepID=A0A0V0QYQ9_PSEPJ|nr:hypothetical protein PPERSA_06973 [Pseudocohnilembus persalinus]|eukprot:KRX07358.1 hypothetical protein PPERSA_06973 [Pseudocohnilembus persalinus]